MSKICLVACVKSKKKVKSQAKDLYTSPLFLKAKEFATRNFNSWYILSAQHHLTSPETEIEPYEKTLNKMYALDRKEWAQTVYDQIVKQTEPTDEITFIAGERYRANLIPLLEGRGHKIHIPLKGKSIGKQLQWLKHNNEMEEQHVYLEQFYEILFRLEKGLYGSRQMSSCDGKMAWPQRGVYFLFEPGEYRSTDLSQSRAVRVGTHMVSRGSKATLWNRLRTHRGGINLSGNHRASVFRRHVGDALIQKASGNIDVTTWGQGQSAPKETLVKEKFLEKLVSEHIGKMSVCCLDVPDEAAPDSDRAYIERNSIALLASSKNIDPPSKEWLGNFSPSESIVGSGLWNVDFVKYKFDPRFLDVFDKYVEITQGKRAWPNESLAPRDWYLADRGKIGRGQLFLFDEMR